MHPIRFFWLAVAVCHAGMLSPAWAEPAAAPIDKPATQAATAEAKAGSIKESSEKEAAAKDSTVKEKAAKAAAVEQAKAKVKQSRFLRVVKTDKGEPTAMETSIARYVPKGNDREGVTVELVSAVHVGEKDYYEQLNKRFEGYDALLYELVAPEGTRVPKGGGQATGVVSGLQNGMKGVLELEFQLTGVDYTKDNFVHADMSPDDFAKAMRDRGESMWSMMFRMMGQSMAQQSSGQGMSDVELMMAMFSKDRAIKLKRLMAQQFENLEFVTTALSGPDGSALIEGRNEAALKVLKKQLAAGKKKVGIFYGAGHMPDLEKRLLADFDLKLDGEEWLEAWNLRDKTPTEKRNRLFPAGAK